MYTRSKPLLKNSYWVCIFFILFWIKTIQLVEIKEQLEALKRLNESKSEVREVCLDEKLGKQNYDYDANELFAPITKIVTDRIKVNWGEQVYCKAIEELNELDVHKRFSK